jgi:hypothetical protein
MDLSGNGEDGAMVRTERRPWEMGLPHGYKRSRDARSRGTERQRHGWGGGWGGNEWGGSVVKRDLRWLLYVCGCVNYNGLGCMRPGRIRFVGRCQGGSC